MGWTLRVLTDFYIFQVFMDVEHSIPRGSCQDKFCFEVALRLFDVCSAPSKANLAPFAGLDVSLHLKFTHDVELDDMDICKWIDLGQHPNG